MSSSSPSRSSSDSAQYRGLRRLPTVSSPNPPCNSRGGRPSSSKWSDATQGASASIRPAADASRAQERRGEHAVVGVAEVRRGDAPLGPPDLRRPRARAGRASPAGPAARCRRCASRRSPPGRRTPATCSSSPSTQPAAAVDGPPTTSRSSTARTAFTVTRTAAGTPGLPDQNTSRLASFHTSNAQRSRTSSRPYRSTRCATRAGISAPQRSQSLGGETIASYPNTVTPGPRPGRAA